MPSPSNGTPDDYSATMPMVAERTTPPESSAGAGEDHKMISSTPSEESPSSNKTPADSRTKADQRRRLMPSRAEVLGWYLYGLCSYSIQTVLIPVIFPLIISQIVSTPLADPPHGWERSSKGLPCNLKEMKLYEGLTQKIIAIHNLRVSPLNWVSASWAIGLIVAAPLLGSVSHHMDHGPNHQVIAGAATILGAVFCFPAGFIKTVWIFPPYVAAIVAAHVVATASHTRQLGLVVRGFTGSKLQTTEFPIRRAISSWLSLHGAAACGLGSAMISAFTYHMLSQKEKFVSLWVVSIFSGIKWLTGILHLVIIMLSPASHSPTPPASSKLPHSLSVFSYPHALGTLTATLLSSFTTMCIFTAGVLYLVGELCIRSRTLLYFWLTYFTFPLVSLPLLHPLLHLVKANAVKMKILGLAVSLFTSGFAFYFKDGGVWRPKYVLLFAGVQGTSVGMLHAFSRVLMMDCAPSGKEGAFAGWHSWITGLGMCLGFAVGSSVDQLGTCLGVAFLAGAAGIVVLMFGNVSDYGGALSAGNVQEDEDDEDDEKGQLPGQRAMSTNDTVSKEDVSI